MFVTFPVFSFLIQSPPFRSVRPQPNARKSSKPGQNLPRAIQSVWKSQQKNRRRDFCSIPNKLIMTKCGRQKILPFCPTRIESVIAITDGRQKVFLIFYIFAMPCYDDFILSSVLQSWGDWTIFWIQIWQTSLFSQACFSSTVLWNLMVPRWVFFVQNYNMYFCLLDSYSMQYCGQYFGQTVSCQYMAKTGCEYLLTFINHSILALRMRRTNIMVAMMMMAMTPTM